MPVYFGAEEGMPLMEELLKGYIGNPKTIHGRLDGTIPRDGELNPNIIAKALGMENKFGYAYTGSRGSRPPMLCVGCPHADSFIALNTAMEEHGKGHVFSDIGCYTLGIPATLPCHQLLAGYGCFHYHG